MPNDLAYVLPASLFSCNITSPTGKILHRLKESIEIILITLHFDYDSAVLPEEVNKLFMAKFFAATGNRFRFAGAVDVDPIAYVFAF